MKKLRHHRIELQNSKDNVEVWADEPEKDESAAVTLYLDLDETSHVDLTSTEARALAALLILAAEQQEKK